MGKAIGDVTKEEALCLSLSMAEEIIAIRTHSNKKDIIVLFQFFLLLHEFKGKNSKSVL